jgi:hypothetical protein
MASAPRRTGNQSFFFLLFPIGSGQRWELRQIEQIDSVLAVIKLANDWSDGGRAAHGNQSQSDLCSGNQSPILNLQTVRKN